MCVFLLAYSKYEHSQLLTRQSLPRISAMVVFKGCSSSIGIQPYAMCLTSYRYFNRVCSVLLYTKPVSILEKKNKFWLWITWVDECSAEVSDLKGTRGQTNCMLKLPGFSHEMCVKFMCHRITLTFVA